MSVKKPTATESQSSFTVDHERTGFNEMPSITRLLNRKSLTSKKQADQPMQVAIPAVESPTEGEKTTLLVESSPQITLSEPSRDPVEASPSQHLPPQIKARKRQTQKSPDIAQWDLKKLSATADPVARAITTIHQKKLLHAALLLRSTPSRTPNELAFVAAAMTSTDQNRLNPTLWSGLCWNPKVTPEASQIFLNEGWLELQPPGTKTNITSARNVIRGAFGVLPSETLTLIRVGPAQQATGVLAIFSFGSLKEIASGLKNGLIVLREKKSA
jgi:hypothetical protein